MSIDRINRRSFINAYNSNSNKAVKNINKTKTFDTVEISSLGKSLKDYSLESKVNNTHKVEEIKTQVDSGTYSIDARLTARSIMNAMKGE